MIKCFFLFIYVCGCFVDEEVDGERFIEGFNIDVDIGYLFGVFVLLNDIFK